MGISPSVANEPSQRTPVVCVGPSIDRVAIVTVDDARTPHNTLTPTLGEELTRTLDRLEENDAVRAIVLRSGKKPSFLVGANLDFVAAIRFAKDAEDASRAAAARFLRLASSKKPVVACVHGAALGGGFELALACTACVAADDSSTLLGLPEIKLGLMPAANGLLRVADRAGLRVAIELGLQGTSLRAAKARRLGLVDEVAPRSRLLEASVSLAKALADRPEYRAALMRIRRSGSARGAEALERLVVERNPVGRSILFRRAKNAVARETHGHARAAETILELLEVYGRSGFAAAAELEPRLFGELVVSDGAARRIELFHAQTAVKRDIGLEAWEQARAVPVKRVAVIGAGLMGAGIAATSCEAELDVRIKDKDAAALARGTRYVKELFDRRVRTGLVSTVERDGMLGRLTETVDYASLADTEFVIEAVYEDLALKRSVLTELERVIGPSCVIATNTSAIPIAEIAAQAKHPGRILGMHYFSPVHAVPLVEVVRTKQTDPQALVTALAIARKQGKTPIVVRDGTGFYTSRIGAAYLNEVFHLLSLGVRIEDIDEALVEWGFSMGPLHQLDEMGIDLAAQIADAVHRAFGDRMRSPDVLGTLRRDDRRGRKNGRGFYLYGRGKRAEKRVDDTIYAAIGAPGKRRVPREEIQHRTGLAMINEALRCLDEGVLRSARDGDVGAVLGLGFPGFRGGPFRFVDTASASEVLRLMRSLEQRLGLRFEPSSLLVEMARKGKRFYR